MADRDTVERAATGLRRLRSEAEWVADIRAQLDAGRYFFAFDTVRAAAADHPKSLELSLLGALALLRSGAVEEARKWLAPIDRSLQTGTMELRQIYQLLRDALADAAADGRRGRRSDPDAAALERVGRLIDQIRQVGRGEDVERLDDISMLRLVVSIHREIWRRLGLAEDLAHARDMALEAFRQSRAPVDGIAAATLSWHLGKPRDARRLARESITLCADEDAALAAVADPSERHALAVAIGEARLLLGQRRAAVTAFERAAALAGGLHTRIVETLRDVRMLDARGLTVPDGVLAALRPPTVVIFAGQPIDPPGTDPAIFPPALEAVVRAGIDARLATLDASIGYCSAAAGSDLLFIEAMLDRGADVTVLLPFNLEDFVATRVRPAGHGWEQRFRNALKLVETVEYATQDRYLGHDMLLRFNNQIIDGLARLRARALLTDPHLMLVWDYAAPTGAGTAADFMDHWPDIRRLHILDLDDLRGAHVAALAPAGGQPAAAGATTAAAPSPAVPVTSRVIRTMLFADIVGFSKLREEHMPAFWAFMRAVEARMGRTREIPLLVESWGDALYVAADGARALADYAMTLKNAMSDIDGAAHGLPTDLQLRIGLHAGPVFEGENPLTGRKIVYGSHVNRAARIEPVALPGNIYASHQFVALLETEESAARNEAELTGRPYEQRYVSEYLGVLPLAKDYGLQPVYHLRKRRAGEGDGEGSPA